MCSVGGSYSVNQRPKGICPSCGKCRDCGSTPPHYPKPLNPWNPNGMWWQASLQQQAGSSKAVN